MYGAEGVNWSNREKKPCSWHISYMTSTGLGTPSPLFLQERTLPVIQILRSVLLESSLILLSLPPYYTNHQQILSALLSEKCTNINQFFPPPPLPLQPIVTSASRMVPLLPLLCTYNLFSLEC